MFVLELGLLLVTALLVLYLILGGVAVTQRLERRYAWKERTAARFLAFATIALLMFHSGLTHLAGAIARLITGGE